MEALVHLLGMLYCETDRRLYSNLKLHYLIH